MRSYSLKLLVRAVFTILFGMAFAMAAAAQMRTPPPPPAPAPPLRLRRPLSRRQSVQIPIIILATSTALQDRPM